MDESGRVRVPRRMMQAKVVEWKVLEYVDNAGITHHIMIGPVSMTIKYPHGVPNLYASRREGKAVVSRQIGPVDLDETGKVTKLLLNPANFADLVDVADLPPLRKGRIL